MSQTYETVKCRLLLESKEFPHLNRFQYEKMVEQEFGQFFNQLPKDVEYLALQDLTPLKVTTRFHYINGVAAVRQITIYDIQTDGRADAMDAEYLKPIQVEAPKAEGTIVAAPTPVTEVKADVAGQDAAAVRAALEGSSNGT